MNIVSCDEDVINLLNSVKFVSIGGTLQPDDILERGAFDIFVDETYFANLNTFDLSMLSIDTFNGCLPIIIKSDDKFELMWVYGYELKFGRVNIYTSEGFISEKCFKSSELKIACDLEKLAIEMRKTSETEGKLKSTSLFS